MNTAAIKRIQAKLGLEPDGVWGPKSIAASQAYLRKLIAAHNPPRDTDAAITERFGPPGKENGYTPPLARVPLPFELRLYGGPTRLREISVHRGIAERVEAVFVRLLEVYPTESDRAAAGIVNYYGCYHPRRMRGGTRLSRHSWAIALDFDADRNGLRAKWPEDAEMPFQVMEIFALEGFMAAGAFWLRDAMHFQFTLP